MLIVYLYILLLCIPARYLELEWEEKRKKPVSTTTTATTSTVKKGESEGVKEEVENTSNNNVPAAAAIGAEVCDLSDDVIYKPSPSNIPQIKCFVSDIYTYTHVCTYIHVLINI